MRWSRLEWITVIQLFKECNRFIAATRLEGDFDYIVMGVGSPLQAR